MAVGGKTTNSGLSRSGGSDRLDPDRARQVMSSVPKGTGEAKEGSERSESPTRD